MEKKETELFDCYELIPKRFGDERGYFSSITNLDLKESGFCDFSQFSESLSKKGILRGLHFQKDPYCQAKAVRCVSGAVLDVVVDLRKDSKTYKKWIAVELTEEKGNMLYVPRGFAHGFLSLKDNSHFEYFVDNEYNVRLEGGIPWDDQEINIPWQQIFDHYDIKEPILSEKDSNRISLKNNPISFKREKTRYLITGYTGQLGYDIVRELEKRGEDDFLALNHESLDITNREQMMEIVKMYHPNVIFHCAAWTNVDGAEKNEKEATLVNVIGTKNIVDASLEVGAKVVYISSDYVFDGTKKDSYIEEDSVNPMNVYGKTKYLGELETRRNPNHFIARISWVFGINGKNFIRTMMRLSENHSELAVVNDQIGSPTYTVDLAKLLVEMVHTEKYGTYHVTNDGYCTWAELAQYVFESNHIPVRVNSVTTEEYIKMTGPQAYRPRNSILDKTKLTENDFLMLPHYQDAVDRFSKELQKVKRYQKL